MKFASLARQAVFRFKRVMANVTRPAIPDLPHDGGCLCGAVRYRVVGPPLAVSACHCQDCRKLTGVAHGVNVLFARDAFEHRQGETDTHHKTADSGRVSQIVRCAKCGVRLWHLPAAGPYMLVAAGTLDDPSWVVPNAHIWIEKAPAGTAFTPDALMIEGQPLERETMIAHFARLYA